MKKLTGLLTALIVLTVTTLASADVVVRGSGAYIKKNDIELRGLPGGGSFDVESDSDNFGAFGEIAKYSPSGLFSFGLEGGYENIDATNPHPAVRGVRVQTYSLLAKLCGHLQNDSGFVPFMCGGTGLFFYDPSVKVAGGGAPSVQIDNVTGSGYSLEAGVRKSVGKRGLALRGGVGMRDAFTDPTFQISGAPGASAQANMRRVYFFAGVEF